MTTTQHDIILNKLLRFLEESCSIQPAVVSGEQAYYINLNAYQTIKINLCVDEAGKHNKAEQEAYATSQIKLYHLWEDLWYTKPEVIKSRIRSILDKTQRIYGRDTEVKRISNDLLLSFLHQNHSAVAIKAKYKYGLYLKGNLVAIASFAPPRKISSKSGKIKSYELLRYANINHHTVVGGLSKLIAAFIKDKQPDDIMTYLDNDWPGGEGFLRQGFKVTGQLPPLKFYIDTYNWQRIHPGNIDIYLSEYYGKSIAEFPEYLKTNNLVTVFNSGSTKLNLKVV